MMHLTAPTRGDVRTLEAARTGTTGFDVDAFHVMEERDNALIADELLHGAGSDKFVYSFDIGSTTVTGISVVGARQLAYHYGGIKHRLVASVQKVKGLFTFTSYPAPGVPMNMQVSVIAELAQEEDFYGVVCEVSDIKTGNQLNAERRETRMEERRDGSLYERPNYTTIAQSKAYRNGVLALIPQDVQIPWKLQQLQIGKGTNITDDVIEQKRRGVLRFATAKGIGVDRRGLAQLTWDQIAGLSEAAAVGRDPFLAAVDSVGVLRAGGGVAVSAVQAEPPAPTPPKQQPAAGRQKKQPQPETPARRFEAELIDQFANGTGQHFSDPLAFAEALRALAAKTAEDEVPTLWENNAAAIGEAREMSPKAAEQLQEPLVAVPLRTGRDAHAAYITAVKNDLATVHEDRVMEWVALNQPTVATLPRDRALEVQKALADRCATLKMPVPMIAPAVDRDREQADGFIADLRHAVDQDARDQIAGGGAFQTVMRRWQQSRPELHAEVEREITP